MDNNKSSFVEPEEYKLKQNFKLDEDNKYKLDENEPDVKIVERLFNTSIGGEGLLLLELLKKMRPLTELYHLKYDQDFDLDDGRSYKHRLDLLHRDLLIKSRYDEKLINSAFKNLESIADLITLVNEAVPVTHSKISLAEYQQLRSIVFRKGHYTSLYGIEKLLVIENEVSIRCNMAPVLWSEFLRLFLMRYILHFEQERYYSYRNYLQ